MNITGSADITVLDFTVVFDLSEGSPTIRLANLCIGSHLDLCVFWVQIVTPSNSTIHLGSQGTPDMPASNPNPVWSTWTMPENWPQLFGHVEWSGGPYVITLFVKDQADQIFSLEYKGEICAPSGNGGTAKNNFGIGKMTAEVKCAAAQVYSTDVTNYLYKSNTGTLISQTWRMVSPTIPSGDSLGDVVVTGTPYAYFTVAYNANGYTIYLDVVKSYIINDNMVVIIRYKAFKQLNVQCSNDYCGLIGPLQSLINQSNCNPCADVEAKNKLAIVNANFNLLAISQQSGCTNIDTNAIISSIQQVLIGYGYIPSNANDGLPPTPINGGGGSGSGGITPIVVPVYTQGTTTAPAACPGNIYPRNIFAPNGLTWIGIAYSPADLVSIMNANAQWSALGVASVMGNCEVSFVTATGVTDVPPILTTPAVGTGSGADAGSGSGSATGCIDNMQHYLMVVTDKCDNGPTTVFPFNLIVTVGSDPSVNFGPVTNMSELLTALAPLSSLGYTFSAGSIPGQISVLLTNPSCTSNTDHVLLQGDNRCNPLVIGVIDINTDEPPVSCPENFTTSFVYEPDGTTIIGIANDINQVVIMMNSNSAWAALGTAAVATNCTISFTKADGITEVPPVIVNPGTDSGCTDNTRIYLVPVNQVCNGSIGSNDSDFPFNAFVNYFDNYFPNCIALGVVNSMTELIARLNAEPDKPSSISYADASSGGLLRLIVTDTDCENTNGTVYVSADSTESSKILLMGVNYHSVAGPQQTTDLIALQGSTASWPTSGGFAGSVCGSDLKYLGWHTVRLGDLVYTTHPTQGFIEITDMSNLNNPSIVAHISLPIVVSGSYPNFSGNTANGQTGLYKGLYFCTDYITPGSTMLYIVESITGTLWGLDTTTNTITVQFHDDKLIGKCPRVFINNKIYFTQDGNIETLTAQTSGVTVGYIAIWDASTGDATGITTKLITANANDPILAATYFNDKIIFFSKLSKFIVYTVSTNTVGVPSGVSLGATFNAYANMSNSLIGSSGSLYISSSDHGSYVIPVNITTGAITGLGHPFAPFGAFGSGNTNNTSHWNFKVIANCYGVLTFAADGTATRGGVAVFSLEPSGPTYFYQRNSNLQEIYNVVVFNNYNIIGVSSYCALP